MSTPMYDAVRLYLERGHGAYLPTGKRDRAGRWFPDDEESADCCSRIRPPSRAWPHSLYRHCFTVRHIAERFGLDPDEVRYAVQRIHRAEAKNARLDP